MFIIIIIADTTLIIIHGIFSLSKIKWPKLNGIIIALPIQLAQIKPQIPQSMLDEDTHSIHVHCRDLNLAKLFRFYKAIAYLSWINCYW